MLRQFLLVSPRGDSIVVRDFRGDGVRDAGDKFFRRIRDSSLPVPYPVLVIEETLYVYLKRSGLYFVLTAGQVDAPLTLWLDLLDSLTRTVKDFCGVLTESTVRKNFPLVYELVDEIFDFGYPQILSTNDLSNVIRNETVGVDPLQQGYSSAFSTSITNLSTAGLQQLAHLAGSTALQPKSHVPRTVPSNASQTPINSLVPGTSGNDIFIDILDRISMEMGPDGEPRSSHLDGLVILKSYMQNPVRLRMGLNDDLRVKNQFVFAAESSSNGGVQIDDCLFHPCADLKDFDQDHSITFTPPQGEFILIRFRSMQSFMDVPIKVNCGLRVLGPDKLEVCVVLKSSNSCRGLSGLASMQCHIPSWISGGSHDIIGSAVPQSVEIQANENKISWSSKRLPSQSVMDIGWRARLSVDLASAPKLVRRALKTTGPVCQPRIGLTPEETLAKYFGPIAVNFELPMHSASKLQIRFLRLANGAMGADPPRRWVRYATQSTAFTVRFT